MATLQVATIGDSISMENKMESHKMQGRRGQKVEIQQAK